MAPVNDFEEMARDPQVLARAMLEERDLPGVGQMAGAGGAAPPGSQSRSASPRSGSTTPRSTASWGSPQKISNGLAAEGEI